MSRNVEDRGRDQLARVAAHSLIEGAYINTTDNLPTIAETHAQTSTSTVGSSASLYTNPRHSVNVIAEDSSLTEGTEFRGRISPVRRFFCLYVTFDFAFTVLLWLICIVTAPGNYIDNLKQQVKYYSIHTSFFDVVMASCSRVIFLLLAYALVRIQHWWMVALTTTGSSAFLLVKVFFYNWNRDGKSSESESRNVTFNVILLLCSFVIAWGEAWFLDFRVLPQEQRARELQSLDVERAPLLHDNDCERTPLLHGNAVRTQMYDDGGNDTAPFYSPIQSESESSDHDDEEHRPRRIKKPLSTQEKRYRHDGVNTLEQCWQILHLPNWKQETKSSTGDVVLSKLVPKIGKTFKLIAILDIQPRVLLQEFYQKVENIPQWNPTVLESKILQTVDNHTDITYQVSADGANGIVKSRDFVTLRHWGEKDDAIVIASIGTSHHQMPATKTYIRGKNGPGALVMQPIHRQPTKCKLQWLVNTDLKGWIPQSIIDHTLSSIMLEYTCHLRKHIAATYSSKTVNTS